MIFIAAITYSECGECFDANGWNDQANGTNSALRKPLLRRFAIKSKSLQFQRNYITVLFYIARNLTRNLYFNLDNHLQIR